MVIPNPRSRTGREVIVVVSLAGLGRPDGTPKRCFPHMFRDTFAVEMLLAGVPIDQVSILLGHKSVKITEKHYAPWVKARQDQLAASVRNAWQILDAPGKSVKTMRARRCSWHAPDAGVLEIERSWKYVGIWTESRASARIFGIWWMAG